MDSKRSNFNRGPRERNNKIVGGGLSERNIQKYTEGKWVAVQWQFGGETCVVERFSSKEAAEAVARRSECTIVVDTKLVRKSGSDTRYFPV